MSRQADAFAWLLGLGALWWVLRGIGASAPSSWRGLQAFPVDGEANFSDTFGAPRGERTHEGIDVFAAQGTPVVAVVDGRVSFGTSKLGGNIAHVRSPDGAVYYYAHLERSEGVERHVSAGDVIGYVGTTGNAVSTPPHLHFEARQGGELVNPFAALRALYRLKATRPA